jgi:phosphoesterase RecJ-like protein
MSALISPKVKELAPVILAEIKKAKSILLHLHPSPDPDSAGSALAMKFALEQLGKKVTVIKGDSEFPRGFEHFPGAKDIVEKNYFEIDQSKFDLFIVLDSSSLDRISAKGPVVFPATLKTIGIDHHQTYKDFANINLLDSTSPATAQILFDLFKEWKITLDANIASNLFIGIYTDTGGLKYRGATPRTFEVAAKLVTYIPSVSELIAGMENSNEPDYIYYLGLALSSVETFLNGKLAVAGVPHSALVAKGIDVNEVSSSDISPMLRMVIGWDIDVALYEVEPGKTKVSFRTRDADKYDVSKLAALLGGGGHKAAAGVTLSMPFDEAKKLVVSKAKELYNL